MHNLYEAAVRDPTIELTDEEKRFPEKIIETETKCLDKLQEEVKFAEVSLLFIVSSFIFPNFSCSFKT